MRGLSDKAGLLIALNLFKYGIGFLLPVYLVRALTQEEYGTYQQLLLIGTTAAGLMSLGLPNSIYYYYNNVTVGKKRALIQQTVAMLLVSATIAALAVFYFSGDISAAMSNPMLENVLPLYCVYILFFISGSYFIHLLISQDRYSLAVMVEGGEAMVRAAIIVVPLLLGGGFTGLIVSIAAYAVVRLAVYSYIVRRDVLPIKQATLKEYFIKEQLSYSFPLALSAIVGLVGRVLDRMVIAVNFTTNQFAIYSVGALELPLDAIFQKSVANVLRATFPPLVKENKLAEIIEIWRASVRKLALVVLPTFVFLLFFSYEFITLLFTEEYAESVGVFRGYLFLVPLHMFVFSVIPPVFGKTAVTFKISLAIVTINVVLSLILVKLIGFYGPVIGTVVSAYAGVAMYLVVDLRLLQCTAGDLIPAKSILMTLLVSVLAGGVGLLVNGVLTDTFVRLLVCGAVYFVTFLAFARIFNVLQDADIALIRRFIMKLPLVGHYAK